jgi:hypothetical protein
MKLPKLTPNDVTRAEYDAFLHGAALVIIGIKRAFPNLDVTEIWNSASETATELYPPFDPPLAPVKNQGDGRRADGIEMSED